MFDNDREIELFAATYSMMGINTTQKIAELFNTMDIDIEHVQSALDAAAKILGWHQEAIYDEVFCEKKQHTYHHWAIYPKRAITIENGVENLDSDIDILIWDWFIDDFLVMSYNEWYDWRCA